ncbi:MAG TPA: hypothetical protein VM286_07425 [Candidatus Thermoplasmatota archaeon]|nr:hypothetical protein [Candidatus Thermoplasmatota archaeon]
METQSAAAPAQPPAPPALAFGNRRLFYWKAGILLVTTVALAPILLWKDEMAATVYLVVLTFVHVAGILVIAVGARRQDIAPDRRGLVLRLLAIAVLVGLLALAADGLTSDTSSGIFWSSLFAIWALHTAGLALLHLRGRRELQTCPFT